VLPPANTLLQRAARAHRAPRSLRLLRQRVVGLRRLRQRSLRRGSAVARCAALLLRAAQLREQPLQLLLHAVQLHAQRLACGAGRLCTVRETSVNNCARQPAGARTRL